jgi:hypothetical protein
MMDALTFLVVTGLVAGCSFPFALLLARLTIDAIFTLAGVRDPGEGR